MEIFFTKDEQWLKKWDAFVVTENLGSHLMLSDWNKSFESYGFDFEICICLANQNIIGGFAAVVAKLSVFKFYIVPFGPVIKSDYDELALNDLIAAVPQRARKLSCSYTHITLPQSKILNSHVSTVRNSIELCDSKPGHLFKFIYSSVGINWIGLNGFDVESKLNSLKASVRRNIRNSYRKELTLVELNTEEMIFEGYKLFHENSKEMGYEIRKWEDIKTTLFKLQSDGLLLMLGAKKNNTLKGAILLIKAGNYYTYVLGGSKKEIPDLRTGDFLQWEAIKLSLKSGFDGYNISLGGSLGVVNFKNSFNTEQVYFENSKHHWVLKPLTFKLFLISERYLKPYKKYISKVLTFFSKIK